MRSIEDLWTFAVALYERSEVMAACLRLQDDHGADVNLVLLGAWLGSRGHRLTPEQSEEASEVVAAWHAEVVAPLRAVRRRLKTGPPPARSAETDGLREQIKTVELAAEKIEIAALATFAAARFCGPGETHPATAVIANVLSVTCGRSRAAPRDIEQAAHEIADAAAAFAGSVSTIGRQPRS